MAILKQNNFSGGTVGAGITTGNSGGASGDALGAVYSPTGCVWTYATAGGSTVAQSVLTASAGGTISFGLTGQTTVYGRFRFTPVSGTFSGSLYLINVRLASLANSGFSLRLDDTMHLRASNRNGSTFPWTSSVALSVGTDYQVEFYVKRETAAGATDGQYGVKLWSSNGLTLLDSGTGTNQNWNMFGSSATFDNIQLGLQGTSVTNTAQFDDIVLQDNAYPGPVVPASNSAPTANAGIDKTSYTSPAPVTLVGTSSADSDGTIVSYLWEQVSGPSGTINSATSSTATFIPPTTEGTCVIRLTVTDNEGATGVDNMTITVTSPVSIVGPSVNVWDGSVWVPANSVQGWSGITWT